MVALEAVGMLAIERAVLATAGVEVEADEMATAKLELAGVEMAVVGGTQLGRAASPKTVRTTARPWSGSLADRFVPTRTTCRQHASALAMPSFARLHSS
jgi:hypothetical protein